MGRFDGKVAFVTGAARGQGRSHAVRFAQEGANVIAVDICRSYDLVDYEMATEDDLAETVELIERAGQKVVASVADVRNLAELQAAFDDGANHFGRIDYVVANAGMSTVSGDHVMSMDLWQLAIDVMLTGVLNTVQVSFPKMVEQGEGGAIVLTSSTAGLKGFSYSVGTATPGLIGYAAAKHGVVGVMRCYANALAPHNIRVNTIHPTGVNTAMVQRAGLIPWIEEHPELRNAMQNALPVGTIEPNDVSNAVLFLCSDEGRYITGVTLPVDAGFTSR